MRLDTLRKTGLSGMRLFRNRRERFGSPRQVRYGKAAKRNVSILASTPTGESPIAAWIRHVFGFTAIAEEPMTTRYPCTDAGKIGCDAPGIIGN